MEFSKSGRKVLRELAGEVYETEAHRMLEELDAKFDAWRSGKKDCTELLDDIHEFHQHQARELWSRYESLRGAMVIERGLAFGFISNDKVPPALRAKLNPGLWAEAAAGKP